MTKKQDAQVDSIAQTLYRMFDRQSNAVIQARVIKLRQALTRLQATFFTVLASKIIGVTKAPDLGMYTPVWTPLSTKSYATKKKKKGFENQFYRFTGNLARSLSRMKADTRFGNPSVIQSTGGIYNNQRIYDNPNSNSAITPKGKPFSLDKIKIPKKTVSIDMFPKIDSLLEAMNVMPQTKENEDGKTKASVAMKLTNCRGLSQRPILVNFMKWWIHVEAKAIVERIL